MAPCCNARPLIIRAGMIANTVRWQGALLQRTPVYRRIRAGMIATQQERGRLRSAIKPPQKASGMVKKQRACKAAESRIPICSESRGDRTALRPGPISTSEGSRAS